MSIDSIDGCSFFCCFRFRATIECSRLASHEWNSSLSDWSCALLSSLSSFKRFLILFLSCNFPSTYDGRPSLYTSFAWYVYTPHHQPRASQRECEENITLRRRVRVVDEMKRNNSSKKKRSCKRRKVRKSSQFLLTYVVVRLLSFTSAQLRPKKNEVKTTTHESAGSSRVPSKWI